MFSAPPTHQTKIFVDSSVRLGATARYLPLSQNWSYRLRLYCTTLFTNCNPKKYFFHFVQFSRLVLCKTSFIFNYHKKIWTSLQIRLILWLERSPPSFAFPGGRRTFFLTAAAHQGIRSFQNGTTNHPLVSPQ